MPGRLDALAAQVHDLLVVGGGVVGCAAAREAARRGLRVALVEARDFGAGTSGATTRLAHGGLRYLEHLDVGQVREGLRERQWLLRAAPHLVEPLPFLLPIPQGRWGLQASLRLGLSLYDALAPPGLPRHRFLDASEASEEEPRLRPEALGSAAAFHDARVALPERLVLEYAQDAARHGAAVANHAPVTGLAREGMGWRAAVEDALGDARVEVRARVVLNAAGPWATRLAGLAGVERPLTRNTRGSHVAFPGFLQRAVVMRASDGRTFFAVPWNEVTLVGTTDLDEPGEPAAVTASAEEVRYLLREAGGFLDLAGAEPCYTTAGVRALLREEGVEPGAVGRGHAILDHEDDGAPGLLSVVGGKLTTARAVASDAIDAVARELGRALPAVPRGHLPGQEGFAAVAAALDATPLDPLLRRSLGLLGSHAATAVAEGPALCARHATRGMLRLAVQQEWCRTLPDYLFRRSLAGHSPDLGAHCRDALAEALGELLGWGPEEREAQVGAAEAEAARRRGGLGA